jgi:hypothetical protein
MAATSEVIVALDIRLACGIPRDRRTFADRLPEMATAFAWLSSLNLYASPATTAANRSPPQRQDPPRHHASSCLTRPLSCRHERRQGYATELMRRAMPCVRLSLGLGSILWRVSLSGRRGGNSEAQMGVRPNSACSHPWERG